MPGGYAVPISTTGPAWFDSSFYARVLASGGEGVRVPAGATDPAGNPFVTGETVPGVERAPIGLGPGTWLISLFTSGGVPTGFAWCTANFVFQNGSSFALGTAGHCAADLSSTVTAFVVPPPDAVCGSGALCAPGIYPIGKFVFAHNGGPGDDFALVGVDAPYVSWLRPTMPVFGGPTGAYGGGMAGVAGVTATEGPVTVTTPASYVPAALGHCGHGAGVGTGGTCRVAAGMFLNGNVFAWYGATTPGDSGSGAEILGDYATPSSAVPAMGDVTDLIELWVTVSRKGNVTVGPYYTAMSAGTTISAIMAMIGSWTLVNGALP